MRTIEEIQYDLDNFKGKKSLKAYRDLKKELNDVRTQENASQEQLGLGDVVESITKATGIKKVVEVVSEVTGLDCGCEERKKKWNEINLDSIKKLFRRNTVNEISEEDYAFLCDLFKDGMPSQVKVNDQRKIHKVYRNVFQVIKSPTSCAPCLRGTVEELYNLYKVNTK